MSYNIEYYVDDIIESYDTDSVNDITDIIHERRDNHVSYSSNVENIQIINDFSGGIYEAIELYKQNYGEFDYNDKNNFMLYSLINLYVKSI